MKKKNICNIVESVDKTSNLSIINLVLETMPEQYKKRKLASTYSVNYVTSGFAKITVNQTTYFIEKGDVFFVIPGMSYCFADSLNFNFAYVSFLGNRAQKLLERFKINRNNFIFKKVTEIDEFWKLCFLSATNTNTDIISESVLLYTLASIEKRTISPLKTTSKKTELCENVKNFIDNNFANTDLTVDYLSKTFLYNVKYLSTTFKQVFGIGVVEYLTKVRLSYAVTLIEQGFTSIKDIAFMCGFHDQLYFSKVFKKKYGLSPKQYLNKI
ncbi:MAG: AraC family transcriptional regulator [Clostridia bacterium]|nr:AraC family transcriptional regulator [Clostridia bacterium]